jgi:ribosomal protein S18 acetylase RimI-like enzyme
MSDIKIEMASIKDIDALQKIGEFTFIETYSSHNSKENMRSYLESNFSTENLKSELTSNNSEFYFAKQEEEIIGYLKINFGLPKTKIKNGNTLEIERIYVTNKHQGKKIGQLLFKKAIEISKQKKFDFVWLGVWEENLKAMQFYKKNGFIEFDEHIFMLGDEIQTDIIMKLELN